MLLGFGQWSGVLCGPRMVCHAAGGTSVGCRRFSGRAGEGTLSGPFNDAKYGGMLCRCLKFQIFTCIPTCLFPNFSLTPEFVLSRVKQPNIGKLPVTSFPLQFPKSVLLGCMCLFINAQSSSHLDFTPLDAERVAQFIHVPAKFLTVSKPLKNGYTVALFYDEYDEFSPHVYNANFFIDVFKIVNSQIVKVATIDKSSFGGGRGYKLDLTPYRLNKNETLIGLRYEVFPSKHPWPWLALFRIKDGKLTCVLEIDMEGHDYEWIEEGEERGEANINNELIRQIAISRNMTNGVYDIISNAKLDGKIQKSQTIKWNGSKFILPRNFISSYK